MDGMVTNFSKLLENTTTGIGSEKLLKIQVSTRSGKKSLDFQLKMSYNKDARTTRS